MVCPIFVDHVYSCVCKMHIYGPYSNVFDRNVVQYIGLPLLNLKHILCGEPNVNKRKSHNVVVPGHQESWSPECSENKVVNSLVSSGSVFDMPSEIKMIRFGWFARSPYESVNKVSLARRNA